MNTKQPKIKRVRLQDGRVAMIEVSKVPSPYIQANIESAGVYGGWGPLSKSKIAKDNNGYRAA